jgi:hypothetical protein
MKDEYGSVSASRHGMTGLQARQSGVDGIPIAWILTLIQVLQEWSRPPPELERFRCFGTIILNSFFYVNINLSVSSKLLQEQFKYCSINLYFLYLMLEFYHIDKLDENAE